MVCPITYKATIKNITDTDPDNFEASVVGCGIESTVRRARCGEICHRSSTACTDTIQVRYRSVSTHTPARLTTILTV